MTRKTALVTRPKDDAASLIDALAQRGIETVLEPMLKIVPVCDCPIDLTDVQGFLATSANGVRALAHHCPNRSVPVWAVGDATAHCARDLGYEQVASANGNAETLAALVAERVDPRKGMLLHAAGTQVAGDISGALIALGYKVQRKILYEARTVSAFSPTLRAALASQQIDMALFFSPRTAATFATLARAEGCEDAFRTVAAYALSAAVSDQLAGLPWQAVHVASSPNQAALLAALNHMGA